MGYKDKIQFVSPGQGQGPVAEKMMSHGVVKGERFSMFLQ